MKPLERLCDSLFERALENVFIEAYKIEILTSILSLYSIL